MYICRSCNNQFEGKYCSNCGEKVLEKSDLALKKILGEFFQALTFANSKFLKSIWLLITKPGKLSSEYIEGRRVGYMTPIALFFIINIMYFVFGRLTDYTPSLSHQYYYTPYSSYAQTKIDKRQSELELNSEVFISLYNSKSHYYAKSLVVINVPILALLYFLLLFKKRELYTQNLIYTFHLFSFVLLIITVIPHITEFLYSILNISSAEEKYTQLVLLIILCIYSFFSIKEFYQLKWFWSVIIGILTFPIIFIAMTCFKFILMHITLYNM